MSFRPARAIIFLMDDLLPRVQRYAQRYGLLASAETVVVGVSGGPDSLCLLHLLRRLAPGLRLWLHVAHLNHGLRGDEADADAAFVAELSDCWGLPCTLGRADVSSLAEEAGLSLEEAARLARYRFLARVAEAGGAGTIVVGHNADDQAETVLMHFLRGSGVAGLRGMLPKTPLGEWRLGQGAEEQRGGEETRHAPIPPFLRALNLVRPLLIVSRAEIEGYCAAYGLRPRFDRSNEDTTLFRNRLRHELLPILETYNPAIREVLAHTAEVLGGDHDVLRTAVEEAWTRIIVSPRLPPRVGDGTPEEGVIEEVRFDLFAWRALPLGLQRGTIRAALHRLRWSLRNINWEHVERAVWLAREGGTGQAATLAAGLELQVGYDTLRVASAGTPWKADVPQVAGLVCLQVPGETEIGGGWRVIVRRLRREELPMHYAANADPWTAFLDADAVGPALILRPRQPGDRFQPQGLSGHSAALNEFMIDVKIARDARRGWPLLMGADHIAWICGARVDQRGAVKDETRAVWEVRFIREVEKQTRHADQPTNHLPTPR